MEIIKQLILIVVVVVVVVVVIVVVTIIVTVVIVRHILGLPPRRVLNILYYNIVQYTNTIV